MVVEVMEGTCTELKQPRLWNTCRKYPPWHDVGITGRNWMYFFRGKVAHAPVKYHGESDVLSKLREDEISLTALPLNRSVEIQTDYRESEAQTDPYTPPFVLAKDSSPYPEIVALLSLSQTLGYPLNTKELELIERARVKTKWKTKISEFAEDPKLKEERIRIAEMLEMDEWKYREKELGDLLRYKKKLENEQQLIQDKYVNKRNKELLQNSWNKKREDSMVKIEKIRKKQNQDLLRIDNRRKKLLETALAASPCDRYISNIANHASRVYVQPRYERQMPLEPNHKIRSAYWDTLSGLEALNIMFENQTHVNPRSLVPPHHQSVGHVRKLQNVLDNMYTEIEDNKREKSITRVPKCLRKIEPPMERPPTPEYKGSNKEEEDMKQAVIMLQALVRGRASQLKTFTGMKKNLALIEEIRTTHALREPDSAQKKMEAFETIANNRMRLQRIHKQQDINDVMSYVEGSSLGRILDLLSKEIIRLQEERRLHAMLLLAERDRNRKEALEAGRRQMEERRRRETDEMFRQMVAVHHASVEAYLEEIVLETIEDVADDEARKKAHDMARDLDNLIASMDSEENSADYIVAELVHSFVLPEVQKLAIRERINQTQQGRLKEVRKMLFNVDTTLPLPTQGLHRPSDAAPLAPSKIRFLSALKLPVSSLSLERSMTATPSIVRSPASEPLSSQPSRDSASPDPEHPNYDLPEGMTPETQDESRSDTPQ